MSERDLSGLLLAPLTAPRLRLELSSRASTASWSILFSFLTMMSGAWRLIRRWSLLSTTSNRRICQDLGGLLERCRAYERVDGQRSVGDTQQAGPCDGRLSALGQDPGVLVVEAVLVHLLTDDEPRVSDLQDLDLPEHLPDDDSEVLVVDVDALDSVDALDFLQQELLQLVLT